MTLRTALTSTWRIAIALACVATGVLIARPAQAATVNYIALGDSYSSGVGTNNYDSSSGSCLRSPESYPALWAASHTVGSYQSVACSGAVTADVLNGQLSALSSATTLVTVTIGGNDIGFADVVTTCVLLSDSACASAVADATTEATGVLPARLDQTYAAIRTRATNATLVVLGYPRLFELVSSCGLFGMSLAKRTTLNNAADTLSSVISGRAAAAGATYVDVRTVFGGHGICASTSWINGTTLPLTDSYHPKASGYRSGYLVALDTITD